MNFFEHALKRFASLESSTFETLSQSCNIDWNNYFQWQKLVRVVSAAPVANLLIDKMSTAIRSRHSTVGDIWCLLRACYRIRSIFGDNDGRLALFEKDLIAPLGKDPMRIALHIILSKTLSVSVREVCHVLVSHAHPDSFTLRSWLEEDTFCNKVAMRARILEIFSSQKHFDPSLRSGWSGLSMMERIFFLVHRNMIEMRYCFRENYYPPEFDVPHIGIIKQIAKSLNENPLELPQALEYSVLFAGLQVWMYSVEEMQGGSPLIQISLT
jgi:hypothetical protein